MPFDLAALNQVTLDLIAARDILLKQGWRKESGEHGGPHCPVTALMEAQGHTILSGGAGLFQMAFAATTQRFRLAYKILKVGLPEQDKRMLMAIPVWNVRQSSGKPAVELFDSAIVRSCAETVDNYR